MILNVNKEKVEEELKRIQKCKKELGQEYKIELLMKNNRRGHDNTR